MIAPDDAKLFQYPTEDILRYCILDNEGSIIGVKEDAPPKFKEAYEHDKKMYDDALKNGVIL